MLGIAFDYSLNMAVLGLILKVLGLHSTKILGKGSYHVTWSRWERKEEHVF